MDTSLQVQTSTHPQPHSQPATSSPPSSTSSSPKPMTHRRSASPLSIDLSTIPPLSQPSPPSNTLLITQLNDPTIFHPASLATIRQHINSLFPLHSFAPLKSFRRIVCSFYDTDSAVSIRQHLDGASLLGNVRARVYFGEPTPIGEQKKYLDRPDAGRLFFISPPPSPPVGWEVRAEDPPNKEVHASDLADALGKLTGKMHGHVLNADEYESPRVERDRVMAGESAAPVAAADDDISLEASAKPPLRVTLPISTDGAAAAAAVSKSASGSGPDSARNRSRSSTVIYDPETHGDSLALPAVTVEDTTMDVMDEDDEDVEDGAEQRLDDGTHWGGERKILAHTTRPPLELMEID